MQGKSKSWKIKFIFILSIIALIKCGSSAPRKSRLDNAPAQKVKRSAGFINYLNSMFYESSFNYPNYNWNAYVPPQPIYETSFIQYPDNNGYNALDGNIDTFFSIYNWPEHDMREINSFKDVPENVNDRALVLTNVGKDDSFTYILENDCDYDFSTGTNDLNWNFPAQNFDEGTFHNFYLIPDQATESAPTTTSKPTEPSVQNLNKAQEDVSPNISIFNCISDPGQKDIIEKALSSKDEEYMVLLIKKNHFLGGKEQDVRTETVLQQPRNIHTEPEKHWKTTTPLTSKIEEKELIPNRASESANEGSSEIPKKVESNDSRLVNLDTDLREIGETESSLQTPTLSTTAATEKPVKNEDQTNLSIPLESSGSVLVDLDLDLKEIAEEESLPPTSTTSTPFATQAHDVKPSEILVKEEDLTNLANPQGQEIVLIEEKRPTINIQNEVSVDIPENTARNLEDPISLIPQIIKVETVETTDSVKNVSKDIKETKNSFELQPKEETTKIESELNQESVVAKLDGSPTQNEPQILISEILSDESKILHEVPAPIIADIPLIVDEGLKEVSTSTLSDVVETQKDDTVISEKTSLIKDETDTEPLTYSKVAENQNIPIKSMDTLTTEEPTEAVESITLPKDVLKPEENNVGSSPSTLKLVDSSEVANPVLPNELGQIDLTNTETDINSIDPAA